MSFVQRHHLTNDALDDFLTMMNLHFPNVVPQSKYLFYKRFQLKKFKKHFFCEVCTHYYGLYEVTDAEEKCLCNPPNSIVATVTSGWGNSKVSAKQAKRIKCQFERCMWWQDSWRFENLPWVRHQWYISTMECWWCASIQVNRFLVILKPTKTIDCIYRPKLSNLTCPLVVFRWEICMTYWQRF